MGLAAQGPLVGLRGGLAQQADGLGQRVEGVAVQAQFDGVLPPGLGVGVAGQAGELGNGVRARGRVGGVVGLGALVGGGLGAVRAGLAAARVGGAVGPDVVGRPARQS